MTSPQSFVLDRSLFSQTLYSNILKFWFAGLPANASVPSAEAFKRWFRVGATEEEGVEFDQECRARFGPVLESIGPEHLRLPAFKSYEDEAARADELAAPFISEVKTAEEAQQQNLPQKFSDQPATDTLLGLILLLDQMPRNIYRDLAGLRLVYTHYDRLAFALRYACSAMQPDPLEHAVYRHRPAYRQWFHLPLAHTEHLPSHNELTESHERVKQELLQLGDQPAIDYQNHIMGHVETHREVIKRFRRFPHRNEALVREDTEEEREYMKTGETFGVKQNRRQKEKDEL